MKNVVMAAMIMLGLTGIVFAQADQAPQQGATIFSFQKELGLSDKQVEGLKALMNDLTENAAAKNQELAKLHQDLAKMLQNKEDIKKVRGQLQKIANMQVDNSVHNIEVTRKAEAILTPDQWKQWKTIQINAQNAPAAVPATK